MKAQGPPAKEWINSSKQSIRIMQSRKFLTGTSVQIQYQNSNSPMTSVPFPADQNFIPNKRHQPRTYPSA